MNTDGFAPQFVADAMAAIAGIKRVEGDRVHLCRGVLVYHEPDPIQLRQAEEMREMADRCQPLFPLSHNPRPR